MTYRTLSVSHTVETAGLRPGESATAVFRTFVADNAAAFDAAFPEDSPARLDGAGQAAA